MTVFCQGRCNINNVYLEESSEDFRCVYDLFLVCVGIFVVLYTATMRGSLEPFLDRLPIEVLIIIVDYLTITDSSALLESVKGIDRLEEIFLRVHRERISIRRYLRRGLKTMIPITKILTVTGACIYGPRAVDYFIPGAASPESSWSFLLPTNVVHLHSFVSLTQKGGVVWEEPDNLLIDRLFRTPRPFMLKKHELRTQLDISYFQKSPEWQAAILDHLRYLVQNVWREQPCQRTIHLDVTSGELSAELSSLPGRHPHASTNSVAIMKGFLILKRARQDLTLIYGGSTKDDKRVETRDRFKVSSS